MGEGKKGVVPFTNTMDNREANYTKETTFTDTFTLIRFFHTEHIIWTNMSIILLIFSETDKR